MEGGEKVVEKERELPRIPEIRIPLAVVLYVRTIQCFGKSLLSIGPAQHGGRQRSVIVVRRGKGAKSHASLGGIGSHGMSHCAQNPGQR